MGAGKSTVGSDVARRLDRDFVDVDREIEGRAAVSISEFFATRGEVEFRALESKLTCEVLERREAAVLALGGGALTTEQVRRALRERALTVLLEVEPEEAWRRSRRGGRPLARDEAQFRALYEQRAPAYADAADSLARDADDVVLAAGAVHVELGALDDIGALVPGDSAAALVTDDRVSGIHGPRAQLSLGSRLASTHELPQGEDAKTLAACDRLWQELRLDRAGTVVALGGGCVTDAAGFVGATYLRGVDWVPVPTTLIGQVDAAIGGKTGINLPQGKNLIGTFHWPARTIIDPALLETLPERERHNGLAEVVKTGLLAGEPLWELPEPEQVRRCAAFKTALCLRDPLDHGPRAALNLGHTFAHALEAAADFELPHGDAVALGLLAALRLSGRPTDIVEEVLRPRPVHVDGERAWAALQRDKKARDAQLRLVLLGNEGPTIAQVAADEVRAELEALISP
jgi:shikimate kinase/3-dehydroquinate synthase